jgi:hypothetical protein
VDAVEMEWFISTAKSTLTAAALMGGMEDAVVM